jgi:hypothetical protein
MNGFLKGSETQQLNITDKKEAPGERHCEE